MRPGDERGDLHRVRRAFKYQTETICCIDRDTTVAGLLDRVDLLLDRGLSGKLTLSGGPSEQKRPGKNTADDTEPV